uniref:RidA family protein n=1 Tax=uncultured Erythrobacter sp. TaxID=263913 RepID=UPI002618A8A3|nr:RidA family protein [uncultured Erythrobacter sp.]
MEKAVHNPTPWLQHFGLNHAVEVKGGERTLYLSGQTASDADGALLHAGDIVAQYKSAWDNMLDALAAAGMGPENLVRLNFYTTDVPQFMEMAEEITKFHIEAGAQVASTLLGVQALYDPDALIEIEATAVG